MVTRRSIDEALSNLVSESEKGAIITLYVKPNSNTEELKLELGELVFYTREPAEKGRANSSLIRYLSRIFNISPSHINIIYGVRSRVKRILIRNMRKERVIELLRKLSGSTR